VLPTLIVHSVKKKNFSTMQILREINSSDFRVRTWPLSQSSFYMIFKFHDYSVIQILVEMNFGDSKSSKSAVFAISGALNFVKIKIQSV